MKPCSRRFLEQPPVVRWAIYFIAGARIVAIPINAPTPERDQRLKELKYWLTEWARMEPADLEPIRAKIKQRFLEGHHGR